MKPKQFLIVIICLVLFIGCISGCNADTPENTTGSSGSATSATTDATNATEETVPETEPRMPIIDNDFIQLYYDDYFAISQLVEGSATVKITDQRVTSKKVGSKDADTAVVYYHEEKNCLIAVGTGTAKVTVNDATYTVTVTSAPISLFMITGHSIGAGQTGVAAQSVLCTDGQAYSSHGTSLASEPTDGVGIGFGAQTRAKRIDAFVSTGAGTLGEGAALAWQWNNLTGEKAWVLNAAYGGSCLNEWAKGQVRYENAVKLFAYAQKILANEIAAGHYRLKDMAIIYHSAANFDYKNVTYTDENAKFWYDSMWNGFKTDLAMDMDGDGENETVQAMGFVPIFTTPSLVGVDRPANFFMGASDEYEDMFMASLISYQWVTAGGLEKYFPDIAYETHGESVKKPTTRETLYTDGVHYHQVAYNALGLNIAENIYTYFRTLNNPESVAIYKVSTANRLKDEIDLKLGRSVSVFPVVEPLTVNDLTITVSENLEIKYPCTIKAKAAGVGTLTISHGDKVLLTLTINVNE